MTKSDVHTQANADYFYSIFLIHELFHYSPLGGSNPHFSVAYTARDNGLLTESEREKLEAIDDMPGPRMVGAKDDAYSEFITDVIQDRCPQNK